MEKQGLTRQRRCSFKCPLGSRTHRAGHLAGGMLMTPPIEAICTGVYLCAAVAIPLIALRAAAGHFGALLGASGDLGTTSIVLFAEIHNCKSRRKVSICSLHATGASEWGSQAIHTSVLSPSLCLCLHTLCLSARLCNASILVTP